MSTALVWFRRDLRLTANPALTAALAEHANVVAVYVHAPDEEGEWAPGAASRWWLHRSLAALAAALERLGNRLVLLPGPSLASLLELARATGARAVYWNRLYEPAIVARDAVIKAALREQGLAAESHNGALLFEPWTVRTGAGEPYRVFTPFWRNCTPALERLPLPLAAPRRLPGAARVPRGVPLAAFELEPRVRWDGGLEASWQPGEAAALAQLENFCDDALASYPEGRNRPDRPATSRLSPHLHFGELAPLQVLASTLQAQQQRPAAGMAAGAEVFLKEIGWREFAHHLLYHYPQTATEPMDARFTAAPWKRQEQLLGAWQRGLTGYPIVDAGMRELWHTGWMHNRVRMIVASLLTKNLQQPWLAGARWFWDTLVDADLASNTLGWQWTAGCGADAAPYYRIFNPMLQTERFDIERGYLRRWLPELAALPDAWIHQPWAAPAAVLQAAKIDLGATYPRPIVEFKQSRDTALAAWSRIKAAG